MKLPTVFLTFSVASALMNSNDLENNQLCDPQRANLLPYNGFRIFRRFFYGWPVRHHWLVVHCKHGRVDYSSVLPASRNGNFPFTQPVCFRQNMCYTVVRKKKYAPRKTPLYASNIALGGIFKCASDGPCDSRSTPVLPVLSDSPAHAFQVWQNMRRVKYVPFAYTPDLFHFQYPRVVPMDGVPKWAASLRLNESYEYTLCDYLTPWNAANWLANTMSSKLSLEDTKIPWEFDAVAHELQRRRWRDRVRSVTNELVARA